MANFIQARKPSGSRRATKPMSEINVTPFVDVMLVLLVIFMITAPMTNPGVVELPKVGETLKQQEKDIKKQLSSAEFSVMDLF